MTKFKSQALRYDVLVIGGGGAALKAAIAAKETGADVLVVSKTRVGFGNNTYISKASWAVPGIADPEDSYRVHVRDTMLGGCFLNDERMVERVARGAGDLSLSWRSAAFGWRQRTAVWFSNVSRAIPTPATSREKIGPAAT